MKRFTIVLLLTLFVVGMVASEAMAVPAFARKYRMSCTTCHAPFPRLKAYGDDFAGNGFQLEDQDSPRYFVDTGDEELDLIRDFPFAVRFDTWVFNDGANEKATDLRSPYGVKLISGGALSEKWSYYFYFFMNERGVVAGMEDAFIGYNDAFGMDLDIAIGQFQVSDPLFKRELRLTYDDYVLYKVAPGNSNIDLTYDRGIMIAYGLPTGTGITLELLNGNGIGGAYADHSFDSDANKSMFASVSQDVGEMFRVGAMTYMGSEDAAIGTTNDVTYIGADGTVGLGAFEINGQWLQRTDSNPLFSVNEVEVVTNGLMAEVIYWPHADASRWYCAGLFNMITSDDAAIEETSGTLHYGYLVKRNLRIGVEGTYDTENELFRGGIGMIVAF
ncbi:hypothetical protein KQI63_05015 [bacterium]|nr:hypothetical protein [bacterium]